MDSDSGERRTARIHDYDEMREALTDVARHSPPAKVETFGTVTDGHRELCLYALVRPSRTPPRGTVLLAAGHHQLEEGGSESVLALAQRLLVDDVPPWTEDMTVVAIPQVNVRWYASPFIDGRKRGEWCAPAEFLPAIPSLQEYNAERVAHRQRRWGNIEDLVGKISRDLAPEIRAVQDYLRAITATCGPPRVTVDFHETRGFAGYLVEEDKALDVRGLPFVYAEPDRETMAAVEGRYPMHPRTAPTIPRYKTTAAWHEHLASLGPDRLHDAFTMQPLGLTGYLRRQGSRAYLVETPSQIPLDDRIGMNLTAIPPLLEHVTAAP